MNLRELIGEIGRSYDRKANMQSPAQQLIRQAPGVLSHYLPGDYVPSASGGKGQGAIVPWIAVFDPDETTTAQRGLYVVFLFAADMSSVVLSLNQGVTDLTDELGESKARKRLASQATSIRDALDIDQTDLEPSIALGHSASLPKSYESGNILARHYKVSALPSEADMAEDLHRFVRLYELALSTREELRVAEPGKIATPPPSVPPDTDNAKEFKPKNDEDYFQEIKGRTLRKTRKHETLVDKYGTFLQARGFDVNTHKVHPRDLTADRAGAHWLIEAKMVRHGNGPNAAREAIGQLLLYQDFIYPDPSRARMLALFNESVGDRCVELLNKLHIAAVWSDDGAWAGCPIAKTAGLV